MSSASAHYEEAKPEKKAADEAADKAVVANITVTEKQTAYRIALHTVWYTYSRGYRFDDDSQAGMQGIANVAASRIYHLVAPPELSPGSPAQAIEFKTRVAETALSMMVDQMIEFTDSAKVITIDILTRARDIFCPIWPIC